MDEFVLGTNLPTNVPFLKRKSYFKYCFFKKSIIIFSFLIYFFSFFQVTLQQRCSEGFRWCGGKLCYNSTMYDSCCGEEGYNTQTTSCCYYSQYSSYNFKCELPQKCCGSQACFNQLEETCCPNQFYGSSYVCKSKSQKCCNDHCCELDQECCDNKCCSFGYACNRKYNPKCTLTYDYRFLIVPIALNCIGIIFIFTFIKEKFCGGIKKVGILNERNFHNVVGRHTSEETVKEYNPERILDVINEKNLIFNSKVEFERFVLGYVHKTFYKSAIFFFLSGTIPLYLILMNRDNYIFIFVVFLNSIMRVYYLIFVLRGMNWMKSTQMNFVILVYGWLLGIALLIVAIKSDDYDRYPMRMFTFFFFTFLNIFPIGIIKTEVSGEELLIQAISGVGGSGKDQYGNNYSSSSKEILIVKIRYPQNLLEPKNIIENNNS